MLYYVSDEINYILSNTWFLVAELIFRNSTALIIEHATGLFDQDKPVLVWCGESLLRLDYRHLDRPTNKPHCKNRKFIFSFGILKAYQGQQMLADY